MKLNKLYNAFIYLIGLNKSQVAVTPVRTWNAATTLDLYSTAWVFQQSFLNISDPVTVQCAEYGLVLEVAVDTF